MTDLWEQILQEASLGGIEFPLTKRTLSGGRDTARIQPAYQPGQGVEDTGRQPYMFELEIPLFADVDESHYPGKYHELLDLFADDRTRAEVEYVDPVIGPLQVKVVKFSVEEVSDARNGATINVSLEENSLDIVDFFDVVVRMTAGAEAQEIALQSDEALDEAGVTDSDVTAAFESAGVGMKPSEVSSSGSRVSDIVAELQASLDEARIAEDEVRALVDVARRRILALQQIPLARTPAGWTVLESSYRLVDALGRLGDDAVARAIPIITWTVPADLTAREVANILYKDPSRTDEVRRRNKKGSLNFKRGMVLRVAER